MVQKDNRSIAVTKILVALFGAALLLLDIGIFPIERAFSLSLPFWDRERGLCLMLCLYLCNIPAVILLRSMWKLLKALQQNMVFIPENVMLLNTISTCCFAACLVFLLFCWKIYMLLIPALAAGFVGLVVRIVKNVFEQAIPMKDELDFTV